MFKTEHLLLFVRHKAAVQALLPNIENLPVGQLASWTMCVCVCVCVFALLIAAMARIFLVAFCVFNCDEQRDSMPAAALEPDELFVKWDALRQGLPARGRTSTPQPGIVSRRRHTPQ